MKAGIRGLVWLAVPLLLVAALSGSASASTGSSSSAQPPATGLLPSAPGGAGTAANADDPAAIAFDEVSLGTDVTDEYAAKGVVFTDTFTTTDGANPTSPVLSGEPKFYGDIVGRFTIPGTTTPATVNGFSLDVGFIDDRNSVEITYYDAAGNQVGATRAQSFGINEITVTYRGVASFKVSAVEYEAAGFAIDNLIVHTGGGIRPTRMAMLGDSYSSGEGLLKEKGLRYDCGTDLHEDRYKEGTTVPVGFPIWTDGSCVTATGSKERPGDLLRRKAVVYKNLCHRHRRAYPNQIRERLGLPWQSAIFVACSSATTENIGVAGVGFGPRAQYANTSPPGVHGGQTQLENVAKFAEGGSPDLITIGIGGNDAKFSEIVKECIASTCTEPDFASRTISSVNGTMFRNVRDTLKGLRAAYPGATIVAFGYPSVVDDPNNTCARAFRVGADELAWIKDTLLPTVNDAVKDAATEAGVVYVDVTAATAGHGVCSKDPWINGVTFGDDERLEKGFLKTPKFIGNESFHPNQKAHDAIASLFMDHYTDGSGGLLVRNPSPSAPIRVPTGPEIRLGSIDAGAVEGCGAGCERPVACIQACPVTIQGGGFDPGVTMGVTLRSDPVSLGAVTADAAGNVKATLKVPQKLEPGLHTVTLDGPGPAGLREHAVQGVWVYQRMAARIALRLRPAGNASRVASLRVSRVPRGARIDLVCTRKGGRAADQALAGLRVKRRHGCPFSHRRIAVGKGKRSAKRKARTVKLASLFRAPLPPNTVLRVVVSSPAAAGRALDARIAGRGKARLIRRCTEPGEILPIRC